MSPVKLAFGASLVVGGCTYPVTETIGLAMLIGGGAGAFLGAAFSAWRAWRRRCSRSN